MYCIKYTNIAHYIISYYIIYYIKTSAKPFVNPSAKPFVKCKTRPVCMTLHRAPRSHRRDVKCFPNGFIIGVTTVRL